MHGGHLKLAFTGGIESGMFLGAFDQPSQDYMVTVEHMKARNVETHQRSRSMV